MFLLRAIMVGLAFFGICYCGLSLLLVISWQAARLFRCASFVQSPRALFALRIFPLAVSLFVTLAFALPAFFWLEGGMDEDVGTLLFCAGAFVILATGCVRVLAAYFRASRLVGEWLKSSAVLNSNQSTTAWCAKGFAPPLLLHGILSSRILVSETAVSVLTPEELRVAIRHEISHVRSRDNLKKLILYGIPFPGIGTLEGAWQQSAEIDADQAAVSSCHEALNLAAALIKLCDSPPLQSPPAFTTALVQLPALVNVRVHRLLNWDRPVAQSWRVRWPWVVSLLAGAGYVLFSYARALVFVHQLTESFIH
jgi:Zn-dependent protease with chaperone function